MLAPAILGTREDIRLSNTPMARFLTALALLSTLTVGCKSQEKTASQDETKPAEESKGEDAKGHEAVGAPQTATGTGAAAAPTQPGEHLDNLPTDSGDHKGAHIWSLALGGNTRDSGRAMAVGPKGEVALAGYFSGKAKLGAAEFEATAPGTDQPKNQLDAFIAAFDKDGKPTWTRHLAGEGDQIAKAVAIDSQGNVIVTGWFGYELTFEGGEKLTTVGADDIFVAKFAPDGRRLWAKRFGGRNTDAGDAIAVDSGGNIYITGVYRDTVKFGDMEVSSTGNADIYLLKLNPDGEAVYVKSYGARYDDFGRAIAIDSQGNLLIFGEFSDQVSFGGPTLKGVANSDLFITKLTASGEHVWSKSMGTLLDELGLAIAVDPADNVIITGSFEEKLSFGGEEFNAQGRGDVYVAKYDSKGNHLWSKQFGGKDKDIGSDIDVDSFGNIFITGWYRFSIDFGGGPLKSNGKKDAFLVKLSPSGAHLWSKHFGGKESDEGRALGVAPDGSVTTSGTFRYKLSVGGKELPYAMEEGSFVPYADIYLARFGR